MRALAAGLLALLLASAAPNVAESVSYEFQVHNVRGLPLRGAQSELKAGTAVGGQPAYRLIAKECVHGVCSTMGINSLAKVDNALFSADGLDDDAPFVLALRVQEQTPAAAYEKVTIVTTRRASVRRRTEGGAAEEDARPVLRVTGATAGPVGLLHALYHAEQSHIVEYLVSTTAKELRGCAGSRCVFHTGARDDRVYALPEGPVHVAGGHEAVAIEFSLRLHERVGERALVDHYLLAAHFSELAERGKGNVTVRNAVDASSAAVGDGAGLSWSVPQPEAAGGKATSFCPTYKHVAALGGGKANVWYLNARVSSNAVPQIVVAFHGSAKQQGDGDESVHNEQFEVFKSLGADRPAPPYLGKVARQYLTDYTSIASELREYIVPDASVLVTGFSRSSGMATLAAADLVLDDALQIRKLYGVTFGSPQVGDVSFLRAFRRLVQASPRFGYFSRVVAADARARVKVDPEVLLPGAVNEFLATYPSVKNIDCMRDYADVAALPRLAAGHLSLFVHVGSRVMLFENGGHTPPPGGAKTSSFVSLRSDAYELAQSMATYPAAGRMDIYVERLRLAQQAQRNGGSPGGGGSASATPTRTLRKHVEELLMSVPWRTTVRAGSDGDAGAADWASGADGACQAYVEGAQPLTVRLTLGDSQTLPEDERVSVSVCSAREDCHGMVAVSKGGHAASTIPRRRSLDNLRFAMRRRVDLDKSYLQFAIVKQTRSPNCRSPLSSAFPPEHVVVHLAEPFRLAGPSGPRRSGTARLGPLEISFVVRPPSSAGPELTARGDASPSAIVADPSRFRRPSADGANLADVAVERREATQQEVVAAVEPNDGTSSSGGSPPEASAPIAPTRSAHRAGLSAVPDDVATPEANGAAGGGRPAQVTVASQPFERAVGIDPASRQVPAVQLSSNDARPDPPVRMEELTSTSRRDGRAVVEAAPTSAVLDGTSAAEAAFDAVARQEPVAQTPGYVASPKRAMGTDAATSDDAKAGLVAAGATRTSPTPEGSSPTGEGALYEGGELKPGVAASAIDVDVTKIDPPAGDNYGDRTEIETVQGRGEPSRLDPESGLSGADGFEPVSEAGRGARPAAMATMQRQGEAPSGYDPARVPSGGQGFELVNEATRAASGTGPSASEIVPKRGDVSPGYDPARVPSGGEGFQLVSEATREATEAGSSAVRRQQGEPSGAYTYRVTSGANDAAAEKRPSSTAESTNGDESGSPSRYDPSRVPSGGKGFEYVGEATRARRPASSGAVEEAMYSAQTLGKLLAGSRGAGSGGRAVDAGADPPGKDRSGTVRHRAADARETGPVETVEQLAEPEESQAAGAPSATRQISEQASPLSAAPLQDVPEESTRDGGGGDAESNETSSSALRSDEGEPGLSPQAPEGRATCSCAALLARDCATPVRGSDGKCTVRACLRMRCAAGGPLRCSVTPAVNYVVVSGAALDASPGQPVDCTYERDVPTPMIA